VLLDALAILRKEGRIFELRLIGDGPERAKLDSLIHQHALSSYVRYTGFLTGDALRESLRDVWCVIMPSIWEETAGLAAIEQMMRGRLVVVSAIGGLGEVVGDAGLKCRPGDAASLAGCLRRVLDDPSLVEVMGRGARDRALQLFARPRMIEEHAAIYRRIVSRSP
jgi:glycosyltransferase involved in cell wall biosynthesis